MKNVVEFLKKACESSKTNVLFCDQNGSLTYEESLEKLERIACYINKKQITNQPILVRAKRSKETLLLFLAIAYSNNYYVPVSDDTLKERLNDIISIGNIKYGFDYQNDSLEMLSFDDACNMDINANITQELESSWDENNPLYLMFTSGSTGKPKGVLKSHKNMLAFIHNFLDTFDYLNNGMKICSQTPFYFDASSKDIYLSLALEGTLYIPDSTYFALPTKVLQYVNDNGINMIMWVPSALTMIAKIRALSFIKPAKLKNIFFIGETFPPKYLNMWIEALPNSNFVNLYGSTETAGAVLYYKVKEKAKEDEMLPIGKPLRNVNVKLEDGEICVCSDQVALGYVNDGERNSETFKNEDGNIYLHTGDYGEMNERGEIVFKSRKDFQIKHLGYRIELQDIENTLSSLSYIDTCCCLYDKEKKKIILLISLSKNDGISEKNILEDAKSLLPNYMVPGKVIIINDMPLNSNGKIDRILLGKKYLEN